MHHSFRTHHAAWDNSAARPRTTKRSQPKASLDPMMRSMTRSFWCCGLRVLCVRLSCRGRESSKCASEHGTAPRQPSTRIRKSEREQILKSYFCLGRMSDVVTLSLQDYPTLLPWLPFENGVDVRGLPNRLCVFYMFAIRVVFVCFLIFAGMFPNDLFRRTSAP